MTHSRSYPVTIEASLPQPHVQYVTKPKKYTCSGWLPFVTAGALALSFLICINVLGGRKVFPMVFNPYDGLIPIVKQGSLLVYPFMWGSSNGIETHYSTHMPPETLTATSTALDDLFKSYPSSHGHIYKNCWLENPRASNPCFFDSSWVTDVCTQDNSYGYEERNGYFSPCFILKFNHTEDWMPVPPSERAPSAIADHFDHGFMPVHCFAKDISKAVNITVYPPKGFSLLFFPVSKFDPQWYLEPLVAVKVDGIQKGQNVTVECSVITPNAFMLWNNGKAVIHFTSSNLS